MNRVRARARTAVVVVDRVRHVRFVVRTVQVNAIPAHGEEDLVTNTVLTGVDVGEVDILAFCISGVARNCATVVCAARQINIVLTPEIARTYQGKRS